MKSAVITGLGQVSAQGAGKNALLPLISAGVLNADFEPSIQNELLPEASPLEDFLTLPHHNQDHLDWLNPKIKKRIDRVTELALLSCYQAIDDAGFPVDKMIQSKAKQPWGISYGSALAGFSNAETVHETFLEEGTSTLPPSFAFQLLGASVPGQLGIHYNLNGPILANSNSCAAGNTAIGEALKMIQLGEASVIIAGASECPFAPLTLSALKRLGVVSQSHPMRPYHPERDGFIPAEASATLIIEEESHAKARGAHIYAKILSYSCVTESHDMTTPERSGTPIKESQLRALKKAGLAPSDIDLVSHHASATQINDRNEGKVMQELYPQAAHHALKAYTGHALGAASALEAVLCSLALQEEGYQNIISNAFGFGGIDTALILQRYNSTNQ